MNKEEITKAISIFEILKDGMDYIIDEWNAELERIADHKP